MCLSSNSLSTTQAFRRRSKRLGRTRCFSRSSELISLSPRESGLDRRGPLLLFSSASLHSGGARVPPARAT